MDPRASSSLVVVYFFSSVKFAIITLHKQQMQKNSNRLSKALLRCQSIVRKWLENPSEFELECRIGSLQPATKQFKSGFPSLDAFHAFRQKLEHYAQQHPDILKCTKNGETRIDYYWPLGSLGQVRGRCWSTQGVQLEELQIIDRQTWQIQEDVAQGIRMSLKAERKTQKQLSALGKPEKVRVGQVWQWCYKDMIYYDLAIVTEGKDKEEACAQEMHSASFESEVEAKRTLIEHYKSSKGAELWLFIAASLMEKCMQMRNSQMLKC
jgi:hypothetical protein